MTGVLIKGENLDTETNTEKRGSCENTLKWCTHKSRSWLPANPQKLAGDKEGFLPYSFQRECSPVDTLTLDFWTQKLWDGTYLLFLASQFVVLYYGGPKKPIHSLTQNMLLGRLLESGFAWGCVTTYTCTFRSYMILERLPRSWSVCYLFLLSGCFLFVCFSPNVFDEHFPT